jgi:hypothetical protein
MNATYIYLVENCHDGNNKVYIGKTKNTNKRYHAHILNFGSNIKYTLIDSVESLNREDWRWLETYWISQFKNWGFEVMNKNIGGGGVEYLNESSKDLIRSKKIGKPLNHGDKLRKPKPSYFGKHLIGNEFKNKPIIQYDLEMNIITEYKSKTEAFKVTQIKGIANAATGIANTAGGFIWKYKIS